MGYVVALIYCLLFVQAIKKYAALQPQGLSTRIATSYFVLKCVVGLGLGLIYKIQYGAGDTFGLFEDSGRLFAVFFNEPKEFFKIFLDYHLSSPDTARNVAGLHLWYDSGFDNYYNDSRTIVKINALLRFISFGYYEVNVVLMNCLSYFGLLWIYSVFFKDLTIKGWKSVVILSVGFITPSVLVWGSGLLKEPVVLFMVGLTLRLIQLSTENMRIRYFIFFPIIVLMFLLVKMYLFALLAPGILAIFLSKYSKAATQIKFICVAYFLAICAITMYYIESSGDILTKLT